MFPNRASETDHKTLPPISLLSSHPIDFARAEAHARDTDSASRLNHNADEPNRERRPPPASGLRSTPPSAFLSRPHQPHEHGPLRTSAFPHPVDEAYRPPSNPKFVQRGGPPPIPGHRDLQRGSPTSDQSAWRSFDRTDSRLGSKDAYSPHMSHTSYGHRDDSRRASWQPPSDNPHRPQKPAPLPAVRDDGHWRTSGPAPRDRPDIHSDAYAHGRAREEERWRDERAARPMYSYEHGPAFANMPSYPHPQDARSAVRPFDDDAADESRRVRQRAGSGIVDEEPNVPRYAVPGARPYGARPYSPPEARSHSAAPIPPPPRVGMAAGMEPPRPNTSLGVIPSASFAASAVASHVPTTTNTVNANRRVAHLLSEQKRRESINTGFEDLRQAIPACRDGQDSKATILKRALEYIRELEEVVERQHRLPLQGNAAGGSSNRSPPDDKDDLRRFGRHGGDEDGRGHSNTRQMTGGSTGSNSSNDAGTGPRIGGLPSNAYGSDFLLGHSSAAPPSRAGDHRPYGPPDYPSPIINGASVEVSRKPVNSSHDVRSSVTKRWADDSGEDQRSPSRRRVSDGDKKDVQRSPRSSNYMVTRHAQQSRSPLVRSPSMERPRDWHPRLENKLLFDSAVRV